MKKSFSKEESSLRGESSFEGISSQQSSQSFLGNISKSFTEGGSSSQGKSSMKASNTPFPWDSADTKAPGGAFVERNSLEGKQNLFNYSPSLWGRAGEGVNKPLNQPRISSKSSSQGKSSIKASNGHALRETTSEGKSSLQGKSSMKASNTPSPRDSADTKAPGGAFVERNSLEGVNKPLKKLRISSKKSFLGSISKSFYEGKSSIKAL